MKTTDSGCVCINSAQLMKCMQAAWSETKLNQTRGTGWKNKLWRQQQKSLVRIKETLTVCEEEEINSSNLFSFQNRGHSRYV